MATKTQLRAPAPAEGEVDRLAELLARSPKDLEAHGAELITFLEQGSTSSLTPHAGRLLQLLEHAHFRRATSTEMTAREAIVRAVLRLGYPWALQLSAEDLGLARLEEMRQRRHGTSRVRRQVLLAAVFLGLGVTTSFVLSREKPQLRPDVLAESERVFTVPTLEQVVPAATRTAVMTSAISAHAEAGSEDDMFRAGFDCLADPVIDPKACLTVMARVMDQASRNPTAFDARRYELSQRLHLVLWELKDPAHPPESTLQVFRELRRSWLPPDTRLPRTLEDVAAVERLATIARVSLERGALDRSVEQATACLSQFPDSIGCHLVLFAAHSALASSAPPEQVQQHGDAMEHHRKVIARLSSQEARRLCESGRVPTPRPLGCPEPRR